MKQFLRQTAAGLRLLLVFTVVLGIGYPLVVFAVGRLMHDRADGSMLVVDGRVVGSTMIGQQFTGDEWFHPRPSVSDYDPLATGASNLGPESQKLLNTVERRRASVAAENGIDPASVPPDALTASGSAIDPDISPAYARAQVNRVAAARGLDPDEVNQLVSSRIEGRTLGFIGEPRVNVLELNSALLELSQVKG